MKVTKREFVKGAAATAVVVATARAAQITPAQIMPAQIAAAQIAAAKTFDLAVFNDWFPQARAFAATVAEQGTRALPVAGDAGRLWYGTLRGLVNKGHRRIAGLTTHTDLLILETLARDTGLRVSQRENAGRLVSWVLS